MLAKLTVASELDSFTGFPGSLETWAKSKVSKCKSVREEVLAKESLAPAPRTCVNYNQRAWLDPWLGSKTQNAGVMTVQRLVSSGEAWQSGAHAWDAATQAAFASDLKYFGTLVAVTKKAVSERDDQEPQAWLPAKKSPRCAYVTEWIGVKYRWKLSIDDAEKQALTAALAKCPNTKIKVIKQAKVTALHQTH